MTEPQHKFNDDQDFFDLNIDQLVKLILNPIDSIRSQTGTDGFLESRCNAFYRMVGFPVAADGSNYFSPGYDVNLNINSDNLKNRDKIIEKLIKNNNIIFQQLAPREEIPRFYSKIFAYGGFNSTAVALGSMYIRTFEKQFGDTEPLEFDKNQIQTVSQRINELTSFYSSNEEQFAQFNTIKSTSTTFLSNHYLKPFIVDPRIQIKPDSNLMAAPFLKDATQLKSFSSTLHQRPYIERVISIRLNNQNTTDTSIDINSIIDDIKENSNVIDNVLLKISNDPEKTLQNSDNVVFNNYFKLMRALIKKLCESVKSLHDIKLQSNFQPVPDAKYGLEGNGTINPVEIDSNNKELENNILDAYAKNALKNISFASDLGLQGSTNEHGFVFSGLDDMVFSAEKTVDTDQPDQLEKLINIRENLGKIGLKELQTIEYIMGEFSGLGLIDIVAIQSAFWLMDRGKLLGLIDNDAYDRMIKYRPNINVSGISRETDILAALKEYEKQLKGVYNLIQLYFDQTFTGAIFTSD